MRQALYLSDYELLGHKETGLDLAQELGIGERTILVTSRYEETGILERCLRLKARMIPKNLAAFVPMSVEPESNGCDAILVDDDPLMRKVWEIAAKDTGKKLQTFSTPQEFLAIVGRLDKKTPIYVDSKLGEGLRGEHFAKELHAQGFKNLYLATGRQPETLPPMPWIKEVVGKEAPWG